LVVFVYTVISKRSRCNVLVCLGTTPITGSSSQATGKPSSSVSSATTGVSIGTQESSSPSVGTTIGTSGTGATGGTSAPGSSGPTGGTTPGIPGSSGTSVETSQGTQQTMPGSPGTTTTGTYCDEMEYINTLIATDSVKTQPDDITDKQDLITKGVDFTSTKPSFVINVPNGGAIVRDIVVFSSNVDEIEVVFTTESGRGSSPIRGAPTSLPTKEFPTEKVTEIVIKVKKTTDNNAPKDVTLSVIACAEGVTTAVSAGNRFKRTSSQLDKSF
jgi:hypothetical protein